MTVLMRYTVICDYVSGGGIACDGRLHGEGNAVAGVKQAREFGWSVRRHDAYCPNCVRTRSLPPEAAEE